MMHLTTCLRWGVSFPFRRCSGDFFSACACEWRGDAGEWVAAPCSSCISTVARTHTRMNEINLMNKSSSPPRSPPAHLQCNSALSPWGIASPQPRQPCGSAATGAPWQGRGGRGAARLSPGGRHGGAGGGAHLGGSGGVGRAGGGGGGAAGSPAPARVSVPPPDAPLGMGAVPAGGAALGPIAPSRVPPVVQPGEWAVDSRSYPHLSALFNPPGVDPAWSLTSLSMMAHCLQFATTSWSAESAHEMLAELDRQCFQARASTPSAQIVAADVAAGNAHFAPLGDLRSVFRYNLRGLAQTRSMTFRPWPIHRAQFVDVGEFYQVGRIGYSVPGLIVEPALVRRAPMTTFVSSAEAVDLIQAFGVAAPSESEDDLWSSLAQVDTILASGSPQASQFVQAWSDGQRSGLPRSTQLYRALTAARAPPLVVGAFRDARWCVVRRVPGILPSGLCY